MREMKDSGIEWVGQIPKNWEIHPVYFYYSEGKNKNYALAEQNLLSLSYGNIIRKDINSNGGLLPASFNTYNIVETDDIIIRPTDLQNDKRSLRTGLVKERGIITSAYIDLRPKNNINSRYYHYLLHSYDVLKVFYNMGDGVRQGLNYSEFSKLLVLEPSEDEQQAIASFLDSKCSEIDSLVTDIEKEIDTLEEYKKSVITEAVTKGLNPDVEMKDSGIEDVGIIPKEWKIVRLKYLCDITTGDEDTQNADVDGQYPFYVRSPIIERCKRFTFDGEGILVAGDGAGAGRIFHHAFGKYAVHQRVYRLYDFKCNSSFLHYYLSSLFPLEMDKGSAQSTVPSMRLPMLLNFKVCLCEIEEQQQIIDYLDNKCFEIDSLITDKKQQLEILKDYKKSFIYEYVTGKKEVPIA